MKKYYESEYEKKKAKARAEAIKWQEKFADNNYSYEELSKWQYYFTKLAKRYGLTKEFKENGII